MLERKMVDFFLSQIAKKKSQQLIFSSFGANFSLFKGTSGCVNDACYKNALTKKKQPKLKTMKRKLVGKLLIYSKVPQGFEMT